MGRRRKRATVHGVLVVDKPRGPTSHDVVGKVRRALRTRSVGHAGTLDPMATGVLVVAVGEATKLVRWLTADDKVYRTTIALGAQTDSLDADGTIVERVPATGITLERVRDVAASLVGTYLQRPPIFSAIRVDGVRLHERARRGEAVEAPEREVTVHRLDVLKADEASVELEVEAAKGFYVRSLGRDLARRLDTCGHLVALRRIQSGGFGLEGSVDMGMLEAAADDDLAREALTGRMLSLVDACAAMPSVELGPKGQEDAKHGRVVRDFRGAVPPGVEPVALVAEGELLAIARSGENAFHVVRGIRVPSVGSDAPASRA